MHSKAKVKAKAVLKESATIAIRRGIKPKIAGLQAAEPKDKDPKDMEKAAKARVSVKEKAREKVCTHLFSSLPNSCRTPTRQRQLGRMDGKDQKSGLAVYRAQIKVLHWQAHMARVISRVLGGP